MPPARQKGWTSHCQQLHAEEKATVPSKNTCGKAKHYGKKRIDYAFWRQFNEKPNIAPGCPVAKHYAVNAADSGAHCRPSQGRVMYLIHNTDFIVARRPAAALVTMTCLAQTMQHVCSRLVGVELC